MLSTYLLIIIAFGENGKEKYKKTLNKIVERNLKVWGHHVNHHDCRQPDKPIGDNDGRKCHKEKCTVDLIAEFLEVKIAFFPKIGERNRRYHPERSVKHLIEPCLYQCRLPVVAYSEYMSLKSIKQIDFCPFNTPEEYIKKELAPRVKCDFTSEVQNTKRNEAAKKRG